MLPRTPGSVILPPCCHRLTYTERMSAAMPSSHLDEPVVSHMQPHPVALSPDQTVAQALDFLRTRQLSERIVYFYVVDAEERLIGVVPTRRLLVSPADITIGALMVGNLVTLSPDLPVRDALRLFMSRRFLALPVVDETRRLVGVVDIAAFTEDIADLAERQSYDDLFQLAGVHLVRGLTPWRSFRDRFPWLLSNVVGGLLAAFISSRYEGLLDTVIVLALFIPVVLALSESVSMQSVSLTVQALHGERIDWAFLRSALATEAGTAIMLGFGCGVVVASVVWLWQGAALVSLIIAMTITLAMLASCLIGVMLTTALRAMRQDPRIAAGPVVLALADLATLLFYFTFATRFLAPTH